MIKKLFDPSGAALHKLFFEPLLALEGLDRPVD